MKNDKLFKNSVIFADLVLFMILCYTAFLGTATAIGGSVVYAAILLTAAMFVGLVVSSLNWLERGGRKPVHA
jgi:hypothetical protein